MTINQRNILIANFMGLIKETSEEEIKQKFGEDFAPYLINSLVFHDDWNQLLPVIVKIDQTFPESPDLDDLFDSIFTFSKQQVFETVSDFLKKHWII